MTSCSEKSGAQKQMCALAPPVTHLVALAATCQRHASETPAKLPRNSRAASPTVRPRAAPGAPEGRHSRRMCPRACISSERPPVLRAHPVQDRAGLTHAGAAHHSTHTPDIVLAPHVRGPPPARTRHFLFLSFLSPICPISAPKPKHQVRLIQITSRHPPYRPNIFAM